MAFLTAGFNSSHLSSQGSDFAYFSIQTHFKILQYFWDQKRDLESNPKQITTT